MNNKGKTGVASKTPPITFCIFSFNRAQFLKNCVDSIQQAAPYADIWIFDDRSDDLETRTYLQEVTTVATVVQPALKGGKKHGGLYHNMQTAIEQLKEHPLVCFLQDDTQLVRPIDIEEVDSIEKVFEENASAGFMHPCYIKGIDLTKRPLVDDPGPTSSTFYRRSTNQSAGIHYSDLAITKPARLLQKGWRFQQSEPENDKQAKRLFGPMIYMYSPFAMWLPDVPTWRGKRKTLGLRLAEKKKRCGFYPFRVLSEQESIAFVSRAPKDLPVAESFLHCTSQIPSKPWSYNPLTKQRWFKLLNNAEVRLRRFIKA